LLGRTFDPHAGGANLSSSFDQPWCGSSAGAKSNLRWAPHGCYYEPRRWFQRAAGEVPPVVVANGAVGGPAVASRQLVNLGRVVTRPLPRQRADHLYHQFARWQFDRFMRRRLGVYYAPVEVGPPPPRELMLKTAVRDRSQLTQRDYPERSFAGSYMTLLDWLGRLEAVGFNLRTVGAIFELGCGTARLLRYFRGIRGIRLVGSDTNPDCIAWCRDNIVGPEYHCNEVTPPLAFASDNDFDLVYAYSVFTHIPTDLQSAWLQEIWRILSPGGFFLCTVLGEHVQSRMLGPEEMARLRADGHLTFTSTDSRASYSTQVGGSGWDVFQTRAEVIRVFGAMFRIVDYVPEVQDLLILQRPVWDYRGRAPPISAGLL
jgi:SAM-dependent methyltransferase